MKKLMSIFGVILFSLALTLNSCQSQEKESTTESKICDNTDDKCVKDKKTCCDDEEEKNDIDKKSVDQESKK